MNTSLLYLNNVVTLELDKSKCRGCGMCALVCPHRVFLIKNKKSIIIDRDRCMECGACEMNCKDQAITVIKGVGCAAAIINGYFKNTEPSCGCSTSCN